MNDAKYIRLDVHQATISAAQAAQSAEAVVRLSSSSTIRASERVSCPQYCRSPLELDFFLCRRCRVDQSGPHDVSLNAISPFQTVIAHVR
jgi:hypothetical protein